jgi:sodium/pantothenate symporter
MGRDLGGFVIEHSTVVTMMIIFAMYTLMIVGFGAYVKYQSRLDQGGKLSSFLTGGGALGPFAIAMIAATNSMAGGTMVGAPGLTYVLGFAGGVIYYPGFLTAAFGLGSVGRKIAILRARTGAVTFLQLLRLRFNNKIFISAMAITGSLFLMFFGVGQITAGAKSFAAATGTGQYQLGLIFTVVITIVYTMTGGIKTLSKVAVVQGVIMLISVVTILAVLVTKNMGIYGGLEPALRAAAETRPNLILADAWGFWQSLGLALFAGVGLGCLPHALSVTMTYNDHKKLARGVIISCIVFTVCQGIMCQIGPLVYAINPNITTADYTTMYVASNLLPSWMAGIIFCGIFAAIQSSVAGVCIAAAAHLSKDFIVDVLYPNADEKTQNKFNQAMLLLIAIVAVAIAWFPSSLTQVMINFSIGALASSWYVPVFAGLYWKRATSVGATLSVILGAATYIVAYLFSISELTKPIWVHYMGNINPFIISAIISILGMYVGSVVSQHKKAPLGVFQVWFCKDYNPLYTNLDFAKYDSENVLRVQ